jgi:hypothetical protein
MHHSTIYWFLSRICSTNGFGEDSYGLDCFSVSRDSAVDIATSYWQNDRGVGFRVPVGSRIFTSSCRSDRLWGPPSLLSSGYGGLFPQGKSGRGLKLTTHLQRVQRSRKRRSVHPLHYTTSWPSAYLVKYRDFFTLDSLNNELSLLRLIKTK